MMDRGTGRLADPVLSALFLGKDEGRRAREGFRSYGAAWGRNQGEATRLGRVASESRLDMSLSCWPRARMQIGGRPRTEAAAAEAWRSGALYDQGLAKGRRGG